jgi:DNA-binding protein HU-beta
MTKKEFVERIAQKSGLTTRDASRAIDAYTQTVTEALRAGDKVVLSGFGTYSMSQPAATTGNRPQTAEGQSHPKFSAGSALKQALKG